MPKTFRLSLLLYEFLDTPLPGAGLAPSNQKFCVRPWVHHRHHRHHHLIARCHWKFHRPTGRATGQLGRWCGRWATAGGSVGRWNFQWQSSSSIHSFALSRHFRSNYICEQAFPITNVQTKITADLRPSEFYNTHALITLSSNVKELISGKKINVSHWLHLRVFMLLYMVFVFNHHV